MNSRALPLTILVILMILVQSGRAAEPSDPVRVMSYNIRYGTAKDGENRWDLRKEFLVETIAAYAPDLLGTQETLGFQRDYLDEHLNGYAAFGVGRDDGAEQGEMAAVFYRTDRFEKLDGGHFWLSETPDVPGSKSWDSSLTRIVTWVKLRDRKADSQPVVWFFNTHFDHRGEQARVESARLIRRQIAQLVGNDNDYVVVTGDFNAGEGSDPYDALFKGSEAGQLRLIDSYRAVHPEPADAEGTFSRFRDPHPRGRRIDWIGCSENWTINAAAIDRTNRDGRTPSDHLPVTAVLTYGE